MELAYIEIIKVTKKCFYFNSQIITKKGFHVGIQRYKCAACNKIFSDIPHLNFDNIWEEYNKGKQTYLQLSAKYACSIKTIQRKMDGVKAHRYTTFPSVVNLLMDTTYFIKNLGVMVFKDSISGQIL